MFSISFPPMNYSFDFKTVCQVADLLVNISSNNFPGSSLLNYALYGSENATYSYKDLMKNYGFLVDRPEAGDLIIGSDGNLGGIYDENSSVVISVPYGKVQAIPKSMLRKYFPKGCVIKSPVFGDYTNIAYLGNMTSYIGNKTFCNSCKVELWNYAQVPNFYPQSVFWFHQKVTDYESFIDMFGYFEQYDNRSNNGSWTIRFVESDIEDHPATYKFVYPDVNNSVFY